MNTEIEPPFTVGDIVETIKGAKFWGEVVSAYRILIGQGGSECYDWRVDVRAIDPGFFGTIHIYPAVQLARRPAPTAVSETEVEATVAERIRCACVDPEADITTRVVGDDYSDGYMEGHADCLIRMRDLILGDMAEGVRGVLGLDGKRLSAILLSRAGGR